ncbi:MAG: ribosomal-processing cysteine protease Prp [Clostridia bacterium]|nr:ribosomal-processing cysteine protease Prp [Clostridia bacterium]
MTNVTFVYKNEDIVGFTLSGHSTASDSDLEGKIVCSAVSSAAYLAANALIEIVKADLKADVSDAKMTIMLNKTTDKTDLILKSFELHITELCKQYPKRIRITTEV